MNDNIRRYDLDIPLYSEFPYFFDDEYIYLDLSFIVDRVESRASEKKKAILSKSSSSHNSDDSNNKDNKDKQIADLTKLVMQLTTQVSSLATLVSNSKN